MTYSKKERDTYNHYRTSICLKLGISELAYNYLRRIGNALHKIYEDSCNGTIEELEYEQKTSMLYAKGDGYCSGYGLNIHYQTDPRGGTIYVSREKIPANNYTIASLIY